MVFVLCLSLSLSLIVLTGLKRSVTISDMAFELTYTETQSVMHLHDACKEGGEPIKSYGPAS